MNAVLCTIISQNYRYIISIFIKRVDSCCTVNTNYKNPRLLTKNIKRCLTLLIILIGVSSQSYAFQEFQVHKVSQGETVYSISRRYNTSTEAIFKLNPGSDKGIKVDQVLRIPGKVQPQKKEVAKTEKAEPQPNKNTITKNAKPSLSFSKDLPTKKKPLTEDSGKKVLGFVTDTAAQEMNKIQNLKFKQHKVKRKETLFSIARKYKIKVDDIKKYNKRLYSQELRKGDRIQIPIYPEGSRPSVLGSLEDTKAYRVKPKETKFGLARRHGITVADFEQLNPGVGDTLSIGQDVVLPTKVLVKYDAIEDPGFTLYEIQPKETMYSLAKRLDISQDSIITLNPYIENGFNAGMVIRIPDKGMLRDSLAIDYSGNKKIDFRKALVNFKPKKIALMLPFNLDRVASGDNSEIKERLKKDRVMRISLDFYTGMKIAAQELKTLGITTEVNVFDTQNSQKVIDNIIKDKKLDKMDVVIGPLYQKNIESVAKALERKNVPVLSPISKKESTLYDNFFQTVPSDRMLQNKVVHYISRDSLTPKNVVIVADKKHEGVKKYLQTSFPDAKIVEPEEENFVREDKLVAALDKNRKNIVFVESNSIPLISNVVPYLNARADTHKVTLFTTDKTDAFDNESVQNRHLSRLHMHYPSIYNPLAEGKFVETYKRLYKTEPNEYVTRGYDMAMDVLLRLASGKDLYASVMVEGTTEYQENKFNYAKKRMGGYYNKAAYLIKYDDDLRLKKVE